MDQSSPSMRPALVAAMLQPSFYPKPPADVTHHETHISHLFFAGDLVFKLKKPVRFPFLDYSTLAKRRFYLNEELRLNRRLAPSVYIGVVPISNDQSGWRLGGWANPSEYVLVMRRLPQRRMLPFLLETEQVSIEMMRELAVVLARFHQKCEQVNSERPQLYVDQVERQWRENVRDLEPFIGQMLSHDKLERFFRFGTQFFAEHRELLAQRATQGWVRDVHGDLHCEHVCFAPEGVQIFDCIEFDANLRSCDLAAEMAFLAMDLEVRGGASFVSPLRERYLEIIEDTTEAKLLPFFKCHRALVRGKVHALRGQQCSTQAMRYFRYAGHMLWERSEPFIVVICGLTGSGKSTLARTLGESLGLSVFNSDVVRKAMAGLSGAHSVAIDQGIYSSEMTAKTYAELFRQTEKCIRAGKGAIIDATFTRREQREKIFRLAGKHKTPLFFIHCSTSEEITRARLNARAAAGNDVSDGRWEIYEKQKSTQQAITEIPEAIRLELDTSATTEQLITDCEDFLRQRLAMP